MAIEGKGFPTVRIRSERIAISKKPVDVTLAVPSVNRLDDCARNPSEPGSPKEQKLINSNDTPSRRSRPVFKK